MARRDRRERVAEVLGLVGIDSLADRRPEALSPLQRLRVALARALVIEPELLILDEPLARLEPRSQAEFRDALRRLHAETETTTLVLTADPREALAMADRLAVMDLGRVVQVGPPNEVYNRPADTFVARFLGPTNLIQGQVEGTDARGDVVVRTPLGRLIGQTAAGRNSPSGSPGDGGDPPRVDRPRRRPDRLESLPGHARTPDLPGRGPPGRPPRPRRLADHGVGLQGQAVGLREGQGVTASVPPEFVVVLPGKFAAG